MWKILKRAGVVIGPLVFFGSLALGARDITELGLSWIWYAVIGGGIFFASVFAIIYGQHKDIVKLQNKLDNTSTNWIDIYEARHGKLPAVPDHLLTLVDNYRHGEPISKEIKVKTSLQYWHGLLEDSREQFLQIIDWLGKDRQAYLQHMRDTAPPGGKPITKRSSFRF